MVKRIDQALLASLDLVFVQDHEGRFIYINPITARSFGDRRDRLLGQRLEDLNLPPDIIQQLQADYQVIVSNERPISGEIRLPAIYQDAMKDYEYTFSPMRGRQGTLEGAVFIAKDITERKQAEISLQESEAKYRSLFEAASDAIFIIDATTYRLLNANWSAARKLGYSRRELLNLFIHDIEASCDETCCTDIIDQLERNGEIIYENRYLRKNGSVFPVEINAQLIEYEDQMAIQSFVRDITERKQAEEALREQQQRFASIAANLPGSIYREIVHADGTITLPYVSQGQFELSGVSAEEVMENPLAMLNTVHPGDRPRVEAQLQAARQSLQPLDMEYRFITRSGELKWAKEIARFTQTESQDIITDGIVFDITKQRQAEEALREQQQQLANIAANIPGVLFREIFKPNGKAEVLYVSEGILEQTGVPAAEVLRDRNAFMNAIHPEDAPVFLAEYEDCKNSLQPLNTEYRVMSRTGELRWVRELTGFSLSDEGCVIADGVMFDITEQKLSEQALNEKQRQLEAIAASFPGAIYREKVHPDGTISFPYISEGERVLSGLDPADIMADPDLLLSYVHPDDRPFVEAHLQRSYQTLDEWDIEYRAYHTSGKQKWVREIARFFQDEQGCVIADGVVLDVTDRKEAQLALERQLEQERLLRRITEQIHQSLDLDTILQTAAESVVAHLQAERVLICRYNPDWSSCITAQKTPHDHLIIQDLTLLGSPCVEEGYIEHYQQGGIEVATDIYEERSPAFIKYLEQFQVRSHLVVPILTQPGAADAEQESRLWGLLILHHCSGPREWQPAEIELTRQIATQAGIAIFQSELYQKLQMELHERASAEAEVRLLNAELELELRERERVEAEVRSLNAELESRVAERTLELQATNLELEREILIRIRIEDALRQSEKRFRDLIETTNDLVWEEDTNNIITYMSPQARSILGYRPAEMVGKSVLEFVVPEQQNFLDQDNQLARDGRRHIRYELTFIHKDGHEVILESNQVSLFDDKGQFSGARGIDRDITARKQAEAALRASEQRYETLAELSPVGVFRTDVEGHCIYVNARCCEILGLDREEALDTPWERCLHPEDRDRIIAIWTEAVAHQSAYRAECRIVHPDGRLVWVIAQAQPELDSDGQLAGYVSTVTDITELKRYEETLRRYERIVSATHDGISLVDRAYTYQVVNQIYLDRIGININDIVGHRIDSLVDPDVFETIIRPHLDRCFAGEVVQYEEWFEFAKAGRCYVSVNYSPYVEEDGTVAGAVVSTRDITDLKLVEEALAESERRYSSLVAAAPVGIYRMDATGECCTYVNERWCQISGISPEATLGGGWKQVMYPDDRARVSEEWARSLQENRLFQLEYRYQRPDGGVAWVDGRVVAERDSSGCITSFVGTVTDITIRKHAELALQASEQRFQEIASTISQFFFVRSAKTGHFLYVSPAYEAMWGRPCESLYHNPEVWMEAIHPEDRELVQRSVRNQFEGQSLTREYRILRPDGEVRWIYAQVTCVCDELGKPERLIGFAADITDRKLVELALRESEARFQQIAENIDDAIFLRSLDNSQLIYVNSAHERIYQCSCKWVYEHPHAWLDSVHPEDRDRILHHAQQELRGDGFSELEYRMIRPDGSVRWLLDHTFPIRNEAGDIYRFAGIVRDITERKEAELALQESEAKNRALIEALPDLIMRISREGIFLDFIATETFKVVGKPIGESGDFVGTHVEDSLPPDVAERRMVAIHQALETRTLQVYEQELWVEGSKQTEEIRMVAFDDESVLVLVRDISDRKRIEAEREQAEEALRQSETRFQTLVKNMPGMVYRYFPDDDGGRFAYTSSGCIELLELQPDVVLQDANAVWALIYPDDIGSLQESVAIAVQNCASWRWEGRLTTPSGQLKWIQGRSRAQETPQGLAWDGLLIDITELKQAREALRISEERLRRLIDALPFRIWVRDASDRLILQNAEDVAHYGNLIGSLLEETTASHDGVDRYQATKQQCLTGEIVRYESTEQIQGEKRSFLRITGALPELDGGIGLFGAAIDITNRKQAEARLQQSEEKLRLIFENIGIGIVITEPPTFGLEFANPFFRNLLGYRPEELVNLGYEDFTHPDDLRMEAPLVEACARGDRDGYQIEKRYICKDGCIIWVNLTATIVRGETNQMRMGIFTVEDITARKQSELARQMAEEALRQAETRHRLILSTLPDLLSLFSDNGTLLDIVHNNPAINLITNPAETIGKNLMEILPPDLAMGQIEAIQQALSTGEILSYVQQVHLDAVSTDPRHPAIRYEEVRVMPADDNTVLVMIRDVSDRKALEESLRRSQAALQDILDNVDASILRLCQFDTGEIVMEFISAGCEALFGYTVQELMNDQNLWRSRVVPEDLETIVIPSYGQLQTEGQTSITYRFQHKDGPIRYIKTDAIAHRDDERGCWFITAIEVEAQHVEQES